MNENMKLNMVIDLIKHEIRFHRDNEVHLKDEEKIGFLKGLRHSILLVREIKKIKIDL
ncbi:MAG: hypothetical protein PHY46_05210 [Candidatus Omnitrophica bacterium]|nr:hypothetical protein [Candidatus Omnitrophota bacterium]